jgi:predicted DNA-binding transcriptional regulator AlpA
MSEQNTRLPNWLMDHRYCTIKHLMRLFNVSRATIDPWCRENSEFPTKRKLGSPGRGNCSTRFVVSEVAAYVDIIDGLDAK